MYHRQWDEWYLPAARKALENLFFSQVPKRASVLDVCCGSGHVTAELVRCEYQVTGVDVSAKLIALARNEVPGAAFFIQDVRSFDLGRKFDAALSTFDSFNHFLTAADLQQAIIQVHRHLLPNSLFVFDMNLEEAYFQDFHNWVVTVNDNAVGLVRGLYDSHARLASTELIQFERTEGDLWQRNTSIVHERCYPSKEVAAALAQAGFNHIQTVSALKAGVRPDVAHGRVFFSARA